MNRQRIRLLQEQYPPGTRIQLDSMSDDPHPIPAGTKGMVRLVDDMGTLHCDFDNDRHLGICPEVDSFHRITEQKQDVAPKMSM